MNLWTKNKGVEQSTPPSSPHIQTLRDEPALLRKRIRQLITLAEKCSIKEEMLRLKLKQECNVDNIGELCLQDYYELIYTLNKKAPNWLSGFKGKG